MGTPAAAPLLTVAPVRVGVLGPLELIVDEQPVRLGGPKERAVLARLALAGGDVTHLHWQPPALGDIDAGLALASLIRHPLVDQANEQAFQQYLAAQPVLVDVMSASHAISAMAHRKLILHAGPPIDWVDMCGPEKGAILGAILFDAAPITGWRP